MKKTLLCCLLLAPFTFSQQYNQPAASLFVPGIDFSQIPPYIIDFQSLYPGGAWTSITIVGNINQIWWLAVSAGPPVPGCMTLPCGDIIDLDCNNFVIQFVGMTGITNGVVNIPILYMPYIPAYQVTLQAVISTNDFCGYELTAAVSIRL